MTPAERARVVDMLPAEVPLELMPPEGDAHRKAKRDALDALDSFFRRVARKIYLSSELAVFYPGEPRFAPDLLAVVDVEPHERMRWAVDHEGKGLDLVIEVHVAGSRTKDHQLNVDRYARLGIREYFLFVRGRLKHTGWRLAGEGRRVYQPIVPGPPLNGPTIPGVIQPPKKLPGCSIAGSRRKRVIASNWRARR